MLNKYKFICKVLITAVLITIAGLRVPDAVTAGNKSDISSAVMNKGNLKLVSIKKYSILTDDNGIKYIGHRGMGGLAPENTLPAFDLAGKLKLWGAECDVRTTADGNWMILHDDTVDRTTDGTGKIQDLNLEQIQSLNIDSGINIAQYKGLKVPKLEDYLLTCTRYGVTPVIEMKPADNLQYYNKFIETIKEYGSVEKTVVISFSTRSLNELRRRDNYLTLGLICPDINQDNIDYVKLLGNAFVDSFYRKITKDQVDLCHKNNIKVGVWTVDDKELANNLIHDGVDYLTTNSLLPN